MNPKWLGFIVFVYLFGIFIGGTYEGDLEGQLADTITTNEAGETVTIPGAKNKIQIMLTPVETNYEGEIGETKWWVASEGYWTTWLEVLVWDFPFCRPYDLDNSGTIEADERHNNDIGVYAGYFLKAFGIVGMVTVLFAMFQFFQGFLPWS